MLFYDSFCIYPCNCYVLFREKIKLSVSVSVSDSFNKIGIATMGNLLTASKLHFIHYCGYIIRNMEGIIGI